MRIIERGNPERERICSSCKSKLAYIPTDVKEGIITRCGDKYVKRYVVCPVCNEELHICYISI